MWALALAILAAGGLVRAAATRIERRERGEVRRLGRLASAPTLTLDQAEDGAVLARKLKKADLETKFKKAAASLKQHRDQR